MSCFGIRRSRTPHTPKPPKAPETGQAKKGLWKTITGIFSRSKNKQGEEFKVQRQGRSATFKRGGEQPSGVSAEERLLNMMHGGQIQQGADGRVRKADQHVPIHDQKKTSASDKRKVELSPSRITRGEKALGEIRDRVIEVIVTERTYNKTLEEILSIQDSEKFQKLLEKLNEADKKIINDYFACIQEMKGISDKILTDFFEKDNSYEEMIAELEVLEPIVQANRRKELFGNGREIKQAKIERFLNDVVGGLGAQMVNLPDPYRNFHQAYIRFDKLMQNKEMKQLISTMKKKYPQIEHNAGPPFQRIPKYELFFKDIKILLKKVQKSHVGIHGVKYIYTTTKQVIQTTHLYEYFHELEKMEEQNGILFNKIIDKFNKIEKEKFKKLISDNNNQTAFNNFKESVIKCQKHNKQLQDALENDNEDSDIINISNQVANAYTQAYFVNLRKLNMDISIIDDLDAMSEKVRKKYLEKLGIYKEYNQLKKNLAMMREYYPQYFMKIETAHKTIALAPDDSGEIENDSQEIERWIKVNENYAKIFVKKQKKAQVNSDGVEDVRAANATKRTRKGKEKVNRDQNGDGGKSTHAQSSTSTLPDENTASSSKGSASSSVKPSFQNTDVEYRWVPSKRQKQNDAANDSNDTV